MGETESVGGGRNQVFRKRDGARSRDRGVDGAQQIGGRIDADEPGRFAEGVEDGGDLRPTLRAQAIIGRLGVS